MSKYMHKYEVENCYEKAAKRKGEGKQNPQIDTIIPCMKYQVLLWKQSPENRKPLT